MLLEERTSTVAWHSDVSYEKQPPGTTFLYILDKPGSGGDTMFVNTAEAYRRLSPAFRERLHGLKALHSGIEQADNARNKGSVVRRQPVTSVHPIIRTHPITGEKAIYVNPQCKGPLSRIVDTALVVLNIMLMCSHSTYHWVQERRKRHLTQIPVRSYCIWRGFPGQSEVDGEISCGLGCEFSNGRIDWTPENCVDALQNRVTCHSAILDWVNGQRRHLARITPQAEEPYETPFEGTA